MWNRCGAVTLCALSIIAVGGFVVEVSGEPGRDSKTPGTRRCIGIAGSEGTRLYRAFEDGTVEFFQGESRGWIRVPAGEAEDAGPRRAGRCVGIAVSKIGLARAFEDGTVELCPNVASPRWVRFPESP